MFVPSCSNEYPSSCSFTLQSENQSWGLFSSSSSRPASGQLVRSCPVFRLLYYVRETDGQENRVRAAKKVKHKKRTHRRPSHQTNLTHFCCINLCDLHLCFIGLMSQLGIESIKVGNKSSHHSDGVFLLLFVTLFWPCDANERIVELHHLFLQRHMEHTYGKIGRNWQDRVTHVRHGVTSPRTP